MESPLLREEIKGPVATSTSTAVATCTSRSSDTSTIWILENGEDKWERFYSCGPQLKPRFGDRFLPSRVGNDWIRNFDITPEALEITPTMVTNRAEPSAFDNPQYMNLVDHFGRVENVSPSAARRAYRVTLQNEILGHEMTDADKDLRGAVEDRCSKRRVSFGKQENVSRRLFQYDNTVRSPLINNGTVYTKSPISSSSESVLYQSRRRIGRRIKQVPWKVLDAPGLVDDFYLNPINISSKNTLAVSLGSEIYTLKNCGGEVKQLIDVMDMREFEDRMDVPNSIAWNPKGDLLAVGTKSGSIHVWDVEASKIQKIYSHIHGSSRICSITWNGDNLLTSGSRDCSIWQKDIRSGNGIEHRRFGHTEEVCKVTWSPDSINLASSSNDGGIFVWDIRVRNILHKLEEHTAAVKALDWSPRTINLLASGGGEKDKKLRIWDVLKGNNSVHQYDMQSQICNVRWSTFDDELVTSHGFGAENLVVLKYDDCKTIKKIATIKAHTGRVLYMDMLPDGENVITGATDELVKFWKVFSRSKKESTMRSIFSFNGLIR